MSQFWLGWNPLQAWVCSVLDPQDAIKELMNCVLAPSGPVRAVDLNSRYSKSEMDILVGLG